MGFVALETTEEERPSWDENGSETYTLNEDIGGIGKCGDVIRGQKLDVHATRGMAARKPVGRATRNLACGVWLILVWTWLC